ncbi:MAG: fructosamine kinase family protein [Leptonema sp. (in: Bacteria)]|nr:fructosamine kinase family protein [Leptonema sp. (in: bacteria)]
MTFDIPLLESTLLKVHFSIKILSIQYYSSSLFPLFICKATLNQQPVQLAIKLIDNQLMAESEANSLHHLRSLNVRSPEPFAVVEHKDHHCLIMTFIEHQAVNHSKAKLDLLKSLANLYSEVGSQFGYKAINFVGTIQQNNQLYTLFSDFWWQNRIEPLLQLCQNKGRLTNIKTAELQTIINSLIQKLSLDQELPRLVHGDLWNGNILFSNEQAYLIDPSIAYSLPEQDFAMLELFGSPLQFTDYQSLRPSVNHSTFKGRILFFQLYPILVHVALFGGSYIQSCLRLIQQLGQR